MYDIHVKIAKEILHRIYRDNSTVTADWLQFEVRLGINQCDDNMVTDVNGRKNVAGAGINNARRIMDLADASQILVSSTVYENLCPRKEYYHAFSQELKHEVKHGLVLKMHQLVKPDTNWLNVNLPSSFVTAPPEPEPKLTKLAAYYFAHSIKNENFILDKVRESPLNHIWLKFLLWFLAKESERMSERTTYDVYDYIIMPKTGYDTIEGQFEWFQSNLPSDVAIDLSNVVLDNALFPLPSYSYLETGTINLVINSKGKQKLKTEWSGIWDEFGLD